MKVELNSVCAVGILLVICAILMTATEGLSPPKPPKPPKEPYQPKAPKKLKIERSCRKSDPRTHNRHYVLKEHYATNDPQKLFQLVLTDVDLVKVAAYTQLKHIYNKDKRFDLIRPLILSAAELLKYYGTVKNTKIFTSAYKEGMYFAAQCLSAMKTDYEKQQCYTWRAALDEANFFCSVFSFHWNMKALYKFHYEKARGTAGTGLKENRELEYTNVKFECQLKLSTKGKSALGKMYTKAATDITIQEKQVECTQRLLSFEHDIVKYESRLVEYYALLGRSYFHDKDEDNALHYFELAVRAPVVGRKSRALNNQVHGYIEKMKVYKMLRPQ